MPIRKSKTRRRHRIQVTHQTVYLPNLPSEFGGLRLVQLSDIHHGLYMRLGEVERAVELANTELHSPGGSRPGASPGPVGRVCRIGQP
jgi:hypothetical protein